MAIKINDYHKSKVKEEVAKVIEYANRIETWRHDHSAETDESEFTDLSKLYDKLEEHTNDLKHALENYYDGINL
jgi:predicted  nucleic acid-binding Zn-ribbon protein